VAPGSSSQLGGINDNGVAAGAFGTGTGATFVEHGFTFNDTTNAFTAVDAPGTGVAGGSTYLSGINNAGSIVGPLVLNSGANNEGWLFPGGGGPPIQISVPNAAQQTYPTAINNNGVIAGSFIDGAGTHGFLDNGGTFTFFNAPGTTGGTQINGINDNGVIVGTYVDSSNVSHGFVFIPGGGAPTNVSSEVSVSRSGFRFNFATQKFIQTDTLTNTSASAITGPIYLILDNLSANATLANASGHTTQVAPIGSPFITAVPSGGSLAPGGSVAVTLQFSDPTRTGITYSTEVLAGSGTP
jgi:uncharacterized membrane protein